MSALLYFSKPDCHGEILWGEASLPADLPAINDDTCCLTVSRDDRKVALVVGKNIHRYELMPTLKRLRRLDPIPIDLETQSILCKSTISFSHDSEQLIAAFQVRVNSRHSVELRLYTWVDATAVLAWKNQDRITLCMVRIEPLSPSNPGAVVQSLDNLTILGPTSWKRPRGRLSPRFRRPVTHPPPRLVSDRIPVRVWRRGTKQPWHQSP